jgi:hypothetical protein
MICPQCKQETEMLLFTTTGTMCRGCKHGRFSAEQSEAAINAIVASETEKAHDAGRDARRRDPELAMQDDPAWYEALFAFVFLMLFAVGSSVHYRARRVWTWLTFRTDCCFCTPNHRLRGNPFVRKNLSHGICKPALAREKELIRCRKLIDGIVAQHGMKPGAKYVFERGTAAFHQEAALFARPVVRKSTLP